jgi:hypothetical protein
MTPKSKTAWIVAHRPERGYLYLGRADGSERAKVEAHPKGLKFTYDVKRGSKAYSRESILPGQYPISQVVRRLCLYTGINTDGTPKFNIINRTGRITKGLVTSGIWNSRQTAVERPRVVLQNNLTRRVPVRADALVPVVVRGDVQRQEPVAQPQDRLGRNLQRKRARLSRDRRSKSFRQPAVRYRPRAARPGVVGRTRTPMQTNDRRNSRTRRKPHPCHTRSHRSRVLKRRRCIAAGPTIAQAPTLTFGAWSTRTTTKLGTSTRPNSSER